MSVPTSVADVIQHHVTLTVECVDGLYLNVIQPRLQVEWHRPLFSQAPRRKVRYRQDHGGGHAPLRRHILNTRPAAPGTYCPTDETPQWALAKVKRWYSKRK